MICIISLNLQKRASALMMQRYDKTSLKQMSLFRQQYGKCIGKTKTVRCQNLPKFDEI